jgi:hypothetical protein
MTDKPIFRQLETPHDRGIILVHHAGDPWAESGLLGLPGCPSVGFRRDSLLAQANPMRLLGLELWDVLRQIARAGYVRFTDPLKGTPYS